MLTQRPARSSYPQRACRSSSLPTAGVLAYLAVSVRSIIAKIGPGIGADVVPDHAIARSPRLRAYLSMTHSNFATLLFLVQRARNRSPQPQKYSREHTLL